MQENGMAQTNRLSAADVSAMIATPRILKFMRETLSGEVAQRISQVSGYGLEHRFQTLWRVEDQHRYYYYALMPDDFWCGAGFYLGTEYPDEYPSLGIVVEVGPRHPRRSDIVEAMRSHETRLGESGYSYSLDAPQEWAGLEWWADLASILGKQDHMAAAREFFMWGLAQVENFRSEYPDLPWGDQTGD